MKRKALGFWIVILVVSIVTQSANGQANRLTAKEAVTRTEAYALQWAADAKLIFVGTAREPGMYQNGQADGWACGYYSAAKDSAYNFYADAISPVSWEWRQKEGYPSLQPIGMGWADSDVTGMSAENHGGRSFRTKHPDAIVAASLTYETIYRHTDHPLWGFWWSFAYYSAADTALIDLHFAAGSAAPAPKWTITRSNPPLGQNVVFTGSEHDTLAILNFSSGTLDSVKIDQMDGYLPDTTFTENVLMQYYDITSYPETAPFEGTLTLFYNQRRFDESDISNEADLQLYRHNSKRWELAGGSADPERNAVTVSGITGFSKWTFGNPNDQPLKVDEMTSKHPENFGLGQNYPNPFNAETRIVYVLPERSQVNLTVYDARGRLVDVLMDSEEEAGEHLIHYRMEQQPSGIYFLRLRAGTFQQVRKIVMMK